MGEMFPRAGSSGNCLRESTLCMSPFHARSTLILTSAAGKESWWVSSAKKWFPRFTRSCEDCGLCARRAAPAMASFGLSPLTPLARLLADPTHHPSGSACAGYVKGKGCPSPPVPGSASSASTTSAIANTTVSCLVAALVLGAVIFDALRGRDTWSTKFRLRRTANWFPVALCYGGFYLYVHELTHIRPLPLERVPPV